MFVHIYACVCVLNDIYVDVYHETDRVGNVDYQYDKTIIVTVSVGITVIRCRHLGFILAYLTLVSCPVFESNDNDN